MQKGCLFNWNANNLRIYIYIYVSFRLEVTKRKTKITNKNAKEIKLNGKQRIFFFFF